MDAMLILLAIIAAFALLGVLASAFGVDTRDGFGPDATFRGPDTAGRGIA